MNGKLFWEYVNSRLAPYLSQQGFVGKKSKNGFIKTIDDGWAGVIFSFYKFAGINNFVVSFELSKNIVQEIFVKYVAINPSDQKNLQTLVFTLSKLLGQRDNQFRFASEADLDVLINEKIIPFLTETVPVFTDRYNKLENIYRLITDKSEENNMHIRPTYSNYMTALIIGWLLYPSDFESVVNTCNILFSKMKEKWPSSQFVELYDRDFNNIVLDLKNARGDVRQTGRHWSIAGQPAPGRM